MPYTIHCHVRENQFYRSTLEEPDAVIDFLFENRGSYNRIKVFQAQDDGLFNGVLGVSEGCAIWGEYSLLQSAQIREQELDCWPDIATNPEYKRVTLDQVDAYYAENKDEILGSLYPVMPEVSEVVTILARENNADLFSMGNPAVAEEALTAPTMRM